VAIARRCLPALPPSPEPRRLYLSAFVEATGEPLDEVLAAFFRGPHSYSGEDVVEISAHGGPAVVAALEAVLAGYGARRATRGEFTRRAVRNGRMDLVDAEALAALLSAETNSDLALARFAAGTGAGELRLLVREARDALAEARGSEDHPLETSGETLGWRTALGGLARRCEELARGPSLENRLGEGHRVVLLGPVNAGKSSLFNRLVGTARALVDARPGTTRDAVSAPLMLEGRRVTLYDTAGFRPDQGDVGTASELERAGRELGLSAARDADLLVWVEDGSSASVPPPDGVRIGLWVENKEDLPRAATRARAAPEVARVSASSGAGLEALRARIAGHLGPLVGTRSHRQQRVLQGAATALREAQEGPDDWATAALERAVTELGWILGGDLSVDDEVYQRFCIGK